MTHAIATDDARDVTAQTAPAVSRQASRAPLGRLLRAELRWIFRRPRTLVVLGLLAVLPVIVGIAMTFVSSPGGASGGDGDGPPGAGILSSLAGNALILPVATLAVSMTLLLPLTAAITGSDALAGEQSYGTLRGWLLAPVSRSRTLFVKAFGVAVFAVAATTLMALMGVLTGLVINGSGSIVTLSGTTLSLPEALGNVAVAVGWVTLQLWAVGAVALAISACTEHPLVVLATVVGGVIVFAVLQSLDALSWLHPFLLNDSWDAIVDVLRDPIPGAELGEGALRALCYIAVGLSLAYARITTKDG